MAKITHFFKTFMPDSQGGIQEVIRQLGTYTLKKGFEVEVIVPSSNPQVTIVDGIIVKSFKTSFEISNMPISFEIIREFRAIIKDSDIIHLHYPYPFIEILSLIFASDKHIVITYHAPIVGRKFLMSCYYPLARKLFQKADIIVPTSHNLAQTENILKGFESKIRPIGLWISKDRYKKDIRVPQDFIEKVKNFGDYALFVGVLRIYKGLDNLLDTAKKVKKNIIIVGQGPEYERLIKRKANENLTNIHFLGFLNDEFVSHLFQNCRFVILPSHTRGECFGMVLLEASLYSKAMISTELGTGTSWVNNNGETGFVIEHSNHEILAEKINYLFDNPKQCEKFGENANKRLNTVFNCERLPQQYIDIYNSLLENNIFVN